MFYFTTDYKLYHNNLNNLSVQAKHNHHTLPATRGSFTHVQNVKTQPPHFACNKGEFYTCTKR